MLHQIFFYVWFLVAAAASIWYATLDARKKVMLTKKSRAEDLASSARLKQLQCEEQILATREKIKGQTGGKAKEHAKRETRKHAGGGPKGKSRNQKAPQKKSAQELYHEKDRQRNREIRALKIASENELELWLCDEQKNCAAIVYFVSLMVYVVLALLLQRENTIITILLLIPISYGISSLSVEVAPSTDGVNVAKILSSFVVTFSATLLIIFTFFGIVEWRWPIAVRTIETETEEVAGTNAKEVPSAGNPSRISQPNGTIATSSDTAISRPYTVAVPVDSYYDVDFDANVVIKESVDGATIYELTAVENETNQVIVKVWSLNGPMEIYYNIFPYQGSKTRWTMVNAYDGDSGFKDMPTKIPTYKLQKSGSVPLYLDTNTRALIYDALEGDAKFNQTYLLPFLDYEGSFDLQRLMAHCGYEYIGRETDVPRGGITKDDIHGDWFVYRNIYSGSTIKLMNWDDKMPWIICESEDIEMAEVPLFVPGYSGYPVRLEDDHVYYASSEVLGVLLQFLAHQEIASFNAFGIEGTVVTPSVPAPQ